MVMFTRCEANGVNTSAFPDLALSIPVLAPLPLHRGAVRIADLDPHRARTGSIRSVYPLGDDALGTKPAGMSENDRALLANVFVEQEACLGIAQQAYPRDLAVEKWTIAEILPIMLDQVESVEDRLRSA
jgi:hypothetical protein